MNEDRNFGFDQRPVLLRARRASRGPGFGDAEARHSRALACFILLVPFGLPAILYGMHDPLGTIVAVLWLAAAVASAMVCARAMREIRRRERARVCPNCGYPRLNPHDLDAARAAPVACPECGAGYA